MIEVNHQPYFTFLFDVAGRIVHYSVHVIIFFYVNKIIFVIYN